jgi:signal transduction histidine kinase
MKKLKTKVFFVIFSLLTLFTLIIFVVGSTKDYLERQKTISDILTRIPRTFENLNKNNRPLEFNPSKANFEEDSRRIYLDFTIYTIILDNDGNYQELVNNTNNDDLDETKIKKIANNIINNHEENIYIGNLYTSKYSYAFTQNNTLIIMDNTDVNNNLIKGLITNTLLFIVCEIIICGFTYLITRWIITPVAKSFEKQKNFVADASHELKTPLSVMVASADAYFNDKDEKWIRNMKNESERMIKLVRELLDLAKVDQEQDVSMEQHDLSNIIESSILTFESLFYENDIKLKYDIKPNIKFNCNEDLIIELMSILIDNAIKHSSEKGKVFVDLYNNNRQIVLEVKNNGEPIKKDEEEKIFERFYKSDTSRNRNKDTYGLGLAIAKSIVEKHKGTISAHSEKGYTTFKITWNQK